MRVMTDLVVEVGKVLLDSLLIWFRKLTRKTLLISIHKWLRDTPQEWAKFLASKAASQANESNSKMLRLRSTMWVMNALSEMIAHFKDYLESTILHQQLTLATMVCLVISKTSRVAEMSKMPVLPALIRLQRICKILAARNQSEGNLQLRSANEIRLRSSYVELFQIFHFHI